MHNTVVADMPKYILPSPDLASTLRHLRAGGKDLFLCTNSGCQYAASVLAFALEVGCAGVLVGACGVWTLQHDYCHCYVLICIDTKLY
jgi:hypothetical protein